MDRRSHGDYPRGLVIKVGRRTRVASRCSRWHPATARRQHRARALTPGIDVVLPPNAIRALRLRTIGETARGTGRSTSSGYGRGDADLLRTLPCCDPKRIGTDACSGEATWFVSTRAVTKRVCSAGGAFSSAMIPNSRLSCASVMRIPFRPMSGTVTRNGRFSTASGHPSGEPFLPCDPRANLRVPAGRELDERGFNGNDAHVRRRCDGQDADLLVGTRLPHDGLAAIVAWPIATSGTASAGASALAASVIATLDCPGRMKPPSAVTPAGKPSRPHLIGSLNPSRRYASPSPARDRHEVRSGWTATRTDRNRGAAAPG